MTYILPSYTLLGNPLRLPVIENGRPTNKVKSTSGGEFVAGLARVMPIETLPGLIEAQYVKGSLFKKDTLFSASFFFYIEVVKYRPTSIDELLKEQLIQETSYTDYSKMAEIELFYSEEEIDILESGGIYFVTEKGHNAVAIGEKKGKPAKRKLELARNY